MIYLSSFRLSNKEMANPNIYPYNVFRGKYIEPFVFDTITVLYGNNGSGKSTLLNITANTLRLKGREQATSNTYGIVRYCEKFEAECSWSIEVDYLDQNFKPQHGKYSGWTAQIIQHELDPVAGIVI